MSRRSQAVQSSWQSSSRQNIDIQEIYSRTDSSVLSSLNQGLDLTYADLMGRRFRLSFSVSMYANPGPQEQRGGDFEKWGGGNLDLHLNSSFHFLVHYPHVIPI